MFTIELCTCNPYRSIVQSRCLPSSTNDWWSFSIGSSSYGPIYSTRYSIHGINQGILQAYLGSLLSGICTLHTHLGFKNEGTSNVSAGSIGNSCQDVGLYSSIEVVYMCMHICCDQLIGMIVQRGLAYMSQTIKR